MPKSREKYKSHLCKLQNSSEKDIQILESNVKMDFPEKNQQWNKFKTLWTKKVSVIVFSQHHQKNLINMQSVIIPELDVVVTRMSILGSDQQNIWAQIQIFKEVI